MDQVTAEEIIALKTVVENYDSVQLLQILKLYGGKNERA